MAFTQRKLGLQRPKYMGPTAGVRGLGFASASDPASASLAITAGGCDPTDATCLAMAAANAQTLAYQGSFSALLSKYEIPIIAGAGGLLLLAVLVGGRRR
jgi:hypothetical protein